MLLLEKMFHFLVKCSDLYFQKFLRVPVRRASVRYVQVKLSCSFLARAHCRVTTLP